LEHDRRSTRQTGAITGANPTAQRRGGPPRGNGAGAAMKPRHRMSRGQNARGSWRREQEWLAVNAPQRCIVCGKWFIKRADKVCSIECQRKAEAQAKQQQK